MRRNESSPLRPDAEQAGSMLMDRPELEEISDLAHQLWIARGSPVGSPDEDWFHAEKLLQEKTVQTPG
jgi:hypothetical protein